MRILCENVVGVCVCCLNVCHRTEREICVQLYTLTVYQLLAYFRLGRVTVLDGKM